MSLAFTGKKTEGYREKNDGMKETLYGASNTLS